MSTFDLPDSVKLGRCDLIEEVIIGEDKLLKFSGLYSFKKESLRTKVFGQKKFCIVFCLRVVCCMALYILEPEETVVNFDCIAADCK